MLVAGCKKFRPFIGAQFVWRPVPAGSFNESQWTIVHYYVLGEKVFGAAKPPGKQSPESLPAHLRPCTSEPCHSPLRVLTPGLANRRIDLQPISHRRYFSEGHACLYHSKRTRIHSQKHHSFWTAAKFP